MRLHEYQAKGIFSKYGIRVPEGILAKSVEDVKKAVEKLGGKAILKSQILVGGRGKAGGIKKVDSVDDAVTKARELFGSIIKGHVVRKIYVEELLDVEREFYVGITIDRAEKGLALILSSVGGMDIEEISLRHPERIAKSVVNPKWGLWDYQIRQILKKAGIERELWREFFAVVKALYRIAIDFEAELTEINPLVLCDGKLIAADARLNIDDNAVFRHKDVESMRDYTEANELEKIAAEMGLNYVKLDGEIGVIANGAGMAMATMDLIQLSGGKPANFLDVGGGASSEVVRNAMNLIMSDEDVRVLFINIFGGITRCDEVAKGLIDAFESVEIDVPVVVRLAGTNEEEGKNMLRNFIELSGKEIHLVDSMEEGARKAVELLNAEVVDNEHNRG